MNQNASGDPGDRRPLSPAQWLDPLVAALDLRLRDQSIRGAAAGRGFVSLALDEDFLWMVALPRLRRVWISPRPLDRPRMEVLGPRRSPLSQALGGRRLQGAQVLVDANGRAEGMRLLLDGPWPHLSWRGWPRPGAIWIADASGHPRAQEGRMEGEPLEARAAQATAFDLENHTRRAEAQLFDDIAQRVESTLRRALRRRGSALRRRRENLLRDVDDPAGVERWRQDADLLAAHLHEVRRGMAEFSCQDFEGDPRRLELDPRLAPHENLARAYRRVRRAEDRRQHVQSRLAHLEDEQRGQEQHEATLAALEPAGRQLEPWLELAAACGVELGPAREPQRRRGHSRRRPYWTWRLDDRWEVRIGRSARDNDEMLRQHRRGRDLWFHAQGVSGSHVILCRGDAEVPPSIRERVARLAAHFSKARHSKTVPVLCTERRYVRKPRHAAPGAVLVEREETLFVEPVLDEGMRKAGDDELNPG